MRKKALMIIAIYLALIGLTSNQYSDTISHEYEIIIDENNTIQEEIENIQIITKEGLQKDSPPLEIRDLTSPSYTSLSCSEDSPIVEGTSVDLQSFTQSAGIGISSGDIDFVDYQIYSIDNGTTSDSLSSNKFAIKFNIPQTTIIYGFIIDIVPTIREDVNFYIRTDLQGANIREGVISGHIGNSAYVDNQLLHVPFSYCDGVSSLTITSATDYYLILEPTVSTSDSFFDLTRSSNDPDDLVLYEWISSEFVEIVGDVQFKLITQENMIQENVALDANGYAISSWSAIEGNHSLVAWYERSTFYSESFGSLFMSVLTSVEEYQVTLSESTAEYKDLTTISALIQDSLYNPVIGKSVTFSLSVDGGQNWQIISSAVTNSTGYATINQQFDLLPDSYPIKAHVNALSADENILTIVPEQLQWQNIDLTGKYNSNQGAEDETKISTTILVLDNDGEIVPNLDVEFWYYFDGEYEYIPHFYSTNASGMLEILYAISNSTIGTITDTHYFQPASYVSCYIGSSNYGDTIVEKGDLNISFDNYTIKCYQDLLLEAEVSAWGEGMNSISVEFACFYNDQWHTIGINTTDANGLASFYWVYSFLDADNYFLRAKIIENDYFFSNESIRTLTMTKRLINLYIVEDGQAKGNGEEIDVEFTSTINLIFLATFEDGSPAPFIYIEIKGRLLDDFFYRTLGIIQTNQTGYACFNQYEELTLVGYQYACRAEIEETGKYDESSLYFKINLTKCTPTIVIQNHYGTKGTYMEFSAYVYNSEGMPLESVIIQFIINGVVYQTISDHNGLARITCAPKIPSGVHNFICKTIEDDRFRNVQEQAEFYLAKGTPTIILLEASAQMNGYLTIRIYVCDSLGRPIEDLSIRVSFSGWTELLTTDAQGFIDHTSSITGYSIGNYLLVLSFEENDNWLEITETDNLLIYENKSEVEFITEDISCYFGEEVYFEIKLKSEDGYVLINKEVNFILVFSNGSELILGSNTTNVQGIAKFRTTISIVPEEYNWGVSYSGDIYFGPILALASLYVLKSQAIIDASDFDAISNSTATFQIYISDANSNPIENGLVLLFIWDGVSWVYIGEFIANQDGNIYLIFNTPVELGLYNLRIDFIGNAYYESTSLTVEMNVIEAPPKTVPDLIIDPEKTTVYDHELVKITLNVPNAIPGSAIIVFIYINGNYSDSVVIINGFIEYYWNSTHTGIFELKFVTSEDNVYFSVMELLTIDVIENLPPEIISISNFDYITEGETLTIEALVQDESGIKCVNVILDGVKYQMEFINNRYVVTLYMLREGDYTFRIEVEDLQGNIELSSERDIKVYGRTTQVQEFVINSYIIEEGTELRIEVLIYSENTLDKIFLILNSSEYQMVLDYQINSYKSVWKITINDLSEGSFELSVKIIESSGDEYINTHQKSILIIPNKPDILTNNYTIEYDSNGDYINGEITLHSFYDIVLVKIWVDGVELTIVKIGENTYNYYGIIDHAKTHFVRIKVTDSGNRVRELEFEIGSPGSNIALIVSLVLSTIIMLAIITTVFVRKYYQKRKSVESTDILIDAPDIKENQGEAQSSSTDDALTEELPFDALGEEPEISKLIIPEKTNQPKPAIAKLAPKKTGAKAKKNGKTKPSDDEELETVKEYLKKVKKDGIIDKINGNGGSKVQEIETIEKLTSSLIEIDSRLLPKEEQEQLVQEKELEKPTILDLKEITEEIEQTLIKH